MNRHYLCWARESLLASIAAVALCGVTACTDDYDLDDEGNYPAWLGGSIYEALNSPQGLNSDAGEVLEGTFKNYVRLIDDLGYAETLGKTGSKTVFPANDEAFARFFQNNSWGVSKYEDLTPAMKRQLLYGSMLDNALLVEMLSNISNGSTAVTQGQALKHTTGANVIDTITHMRGIAQLPQNNSYWAKYADKGIHFVMDATRPMMVHFTEEQMTANNISTQVAVEGDVSDFEVLTGSAYDAEQHSAYIFRNKIIHADVTCKNGYIHQMQDVLLPPGNLAEVIRTSGESNLFSRMIDRFSAPYYNAATTNNYNDYAQANGLELIDSIFQKRYMSELSQGQAALSNDPNGTPAQYKLKFDPGWNAFGQSSTASASTDIAAIFVPTDEALRHYFLPGGEGEFLINTFGKQPNTADHLAENIDSIPLQNVQQLVNNLMQTSFVGTVPSKFGHVMDEASDPMGLSLSVLNRNSDGTYDVKIANNGVAYMLNKMFAPPSLIAVSAPVTLSSNMRVMNVAVHDGNASSTPLALGLNYYAYLLAMSANYAFFIPTDDAFQRFYVDPAYLGEDQPRALKFYYTPRSPYVYCSQWKYDPLTGEVGDSIGMVPTASFRSQLTDILNYHTIVLSKGEKLGANHYYKTKHGGEIYFTGETVASGAQLPQTTNAINAQTTNIPASNITQIYNQKNGTAYAIDRVIQAPQQSVLNVLQADSTRFSEFLALCSDFDMDDIMGFASDKLAEVNSVTNKKRMDAYHTFAAKGGLTDNVNYFNSYNYTVYAPDNNAMQIAYDRGLPRWSDIKVLYDQYNDLLEEQRAAGSISEEVQAARNKALAMVEEINGFIRYHFQDNSVYADNIIDAGPYPTACSDTLGIRVKLNVDGGSGRIIVTDKRGQQVEIDASSTTKVVNQMARDYVLNKTTHTINTSSFAVVHQISTPFSTHTDTDRYDALWTGSNARQKLAAYRRLYDEKLYRRYDPIIYEHE